MLRVPVDPLHQHPPASTGYFLAAISKSRVLSHESASFRSPLTNGPHLLVPEDLAEVEVEVQVQGLVTYE